MRFKRILHVEVTTVAPHLQFLQLFSDIWLKQPRSFDRCESSLGHAPFKAGVLERHPTSRLHDASHGVRRQRKDPLGQARVLRV